MGELLTFEDRRGESHTLNRVEIGDPEIDTKGFKSYLWHYTRKESGCIKTISEVVINAPTLPEADQVFLDHLRKNIASTDCWRYNHGQWYVRCEGGAFYPPKKPQVI